MSDLWWEDPEKSSDTWLQLEDADDDGYWTAYAKWDGCVSIRRAGEQIHICGPKMIDQWIARLTELRDKALAYHTDHGNAEWFR